MTANKSRTKQAKVIRFSRKIHRIAGISLFVFFSIVGVSGLVLGWKKNSNGYILPHTTKGTTSNLKEWQPIYQLKESAFKILHDSISPHLSTKLSRIDIRNRKGIVKFVFKEHYNEIQLDGATGKLLQIGHRRSDLFEDIHDGTIVDDYFHLNGYFKLFYTSLMGLALLIFTISGFWLWYGPKKLRRTSRSVTV